MMVNLTGDPADERARTHFQIRLEIGALQIVLRCDNPGFLAMLKRRYANFLRPTGHPPTACGAGSRPGGLSHHCNHEPRDAHSICLDITLTPPSGAADEDDLEVRFEAGRWVMRRGDFRAEWDPVSGRGRVRQSAYPYAIDSVMRIILGLTLVRSGGFLLHSASAVRGGRAFLFSGVSGAGKSTIARLAPPDSALLSDEISCVRRVGDGYHAFGTPFAGELGVAGEGIQAPVAALYFLRQGPRNRIGAIDPARAAAMLLRNILFFADDPALVKQIFTIACDFAARVAAAELTFRPDPAVWELIA